MRFSKMQGIGNDYIYINTMLETVESPEFLAKRLSDRHFSIGSDGLVLIGKSDIADFKMRMFNPDGTEGEMCGNAIRCVGKYVYDKRITEKTQITVETLAGIKTLCLQQKNGKVHSVRVNMGRATYDKKLIPVVYDAPYVINAPLRMESGEIRITALSMGNPHSVVIIKDDAEIDMQLAERLSNLISVFPKRTNVEFVKILDCENIMVRVYERGTGETLACGTGACASVCAAHKLGYTAAKVSVHLLGGKLTVEITDNGTFMTGGAEFSFEGEIQI